MILVSQSWDKNRKLALSVDSDVEILTPNVMALGGRDFGRQISYERGVPVNGISVLIRRDMPLSALHHVKIQGEDGHLQAQKCNLCQNLDLGLPSPQKCEK